MKNKKIAIVIHGGASGRAKDTEYYSITQDEKYIKEAVLAGYKVLEQGGSSVDAVEQSIRSMEDNPIFNAGTGAVLTSIGTIELDAMIMNGFTSQLGAVACVDCTKNPVSLARLVMEKSPHCLMVASGAKQFAISQNYAVIDSIECLLTEKSRKELESFGNFSGTLKGFMNVPDTQLKGCDTVGAVAIDKSGAIACATSTGGISGKLPGRVGDAPLVGCGGFANRFGGASCTGHGESLMKALCCRQIVSQLEDGKSPYDATKIVLDEIYRNTLSCGGGICINSEGDIGIYHSSEFMSFAFLKDDGIVHTFADTQFNK